MPGCSCCIGLLLLLHHAWSRQSTPNWQLHAAGSTGPHALQAGLHVVNTLLLLLVWLNYAANDLLALSIAVRLFVVPLTRGSEAIVRRTPAWCGWTTKSDQKHRGSREADGCQLQRFLVVVSTLSIGFRLE